MIKRLLHCVREYKKDTVLAPITVTLEVIMEVIIPLLMSRLIDNGINGNGGAGNMAYILKIGAVLIGCCALSLTFGGLAGHYAATSSAGFAKNLRHDMYYKVQTFSFSSIDKFSTSGIVTRMTTDVSNLQMAFQMGVRVAFRSPAMFIFSLIMAFSINARLSLIFLLVIVVLGVGLYFIMTHAHPIFERVFKTYDKLNNVVQENLSGIRVVKSYVRAEHEGQKFKTVSQSIYRDFSKAERLLAFNSPLMQFCMYGSILSIAWFGSHLIVSNSLTQGELLSLISYASQILMSLMMLSMIFVQLTISKACAERVCEILNEQSTVQNPKKPVLEVPNGSVEFKNVSFSYAGRPESYCLKNIQVQIKSGQTVGIIGGTGSAKSSFVNLIPRLYDATEGAVLVGGRNVKEYDLEALRNAVAVVLQKNVLFSGTIAENLKWGNEQATKEELVHACKLAQANEFITALPQGYNTYIEQGGTNVSGGQKQRLCIARALLKKPKILILDDSTSAVDTKTDLLIRNALIHELPQTTKLIIAQRISSVQAADLILVFDNGKIVAAGTHEQLLQSSNIYREVYTSQNKGGALQ